jgi:hypothetical protein
MPIPSLNSSGFLPAGIYECTLEEIKARFGAFQCSDRRIRLFEKLNAFFHEARASGLVSSIVVDGSFVTSEAEPNDIDLILELAGSYDITAEISVVAYNVLSRQRVRRRFGFDVLLARSGSPEVERWVEFFQQVRLAPGLRKGILRVQL